MRFLLLILLCLPAALVAQDRPTPGDWPQFRGWRASGVSDGESLPTTWNGKSGSNIVWKTPIPGLGHASPISAGGRLFIVSAISGTNEHDLKVGLYGNITPVEDDSRHVWTLHCLSAQTGQPIWCRVIHEGRPQIKRHTKGSHASSTPATDGCHVVVSLGSEGLYCFDLWGRLCWKQDLGRLDSGYFRVPAAQWGFGSSPIIYRDMVIVQCDVQKGSFLAAFNIHNGCEVWRVPRNDVPTWSSPTIYEGSSGPALIVNGFHHAGGYDPLTGRELWRLSGGGDIPVPTPIVAHDLIFLSSAHGPSSPLCAVRPSAHGTLTPPSSKQNSKSSESPIEWYLPRDATYMQTPIVYGNEIYACKDSGVLSCYDARTGERHYRTRLGRGDTGFTASPVAGDGKLYFTSELGDVFVVKAGTEFEQLAENPMGEFCMATPAIANGLLIVRGKDSVFAIAQADRATRLARCRELTRKTWRRFDPLNGAVRLLGLETPR